MEPKPFSYSILTPDEYIKSRVEFKIESYRQKGNRYRWGYTIMAAVATMGAAAVPVLINLEGVSKIVPTLLSLLVTILVGLEGLLHLREHWRNYDLMKSFLRQELHLYRAGAGTYREKPFTSESFALFVERIEGEIAKERSQTIEMRTTKVVEPEPRKEVPAKSQMLHGATEPKTPGNHS